MKWKRLDTGDYESDCKTYKISLEYWGCVRPTTFVLYRNGKRYCSESLLKKAKETAYNLSIQNVG